VINNNNNRREEGHGNVLYMWHFDINNTHFADLFIIVLLWDFLPRQAESGIFYRCKYANVGIKLLNTESKETKNRQLLYKTQ
jgi:hypothetical protein